MAKAIKDVPIGAIIEATATDPGVLADIPSWARTTGTKSLKWSVRENWYDFTYGG